MLIFGIDKFMSECRALVNFIGNAVATLFVARWNGELDVDRVRKVFASNDLPPLDDLSEQVTDEGGGVPPAGQDNSQVPVPTFAGSTPRP
jgi:aerobic C4-dicarboxylate transport protein